MGALEAVLQYRAQEQQKQQAQGEQVAQAFQIFQQARQQAQANQLAQLQMKANLAEKGLVIDPTSPSGFKIDTSLQDPLTQLLTAGKVGEAAKNLNLPDVFQKAQQSVQSLSGTPIGNAIQPAAQATSNPNDLMNQKDAFGEYTPQAKIAQEVEKQKQTLEAKAKIPTAQQKNDLTATENQIKSIKDLRALADKVPGGRIAGSISGVLSSVTGGELATETRQYLKQRPAYAVSIYRALTGDTRLSDADAKGRALPLLWHPTESDKIKKTSFDTIENALQARKKLIEEGKYTQDANGQFITPLEDVLAEAENVGKKSNPISFDSIEAAEKANLPKGTIVTINGRKARID